MRERSISTRVSGFPSSELRRTSAVPGVARTMSAICVAATDTSSRVAPITTSWIGDWLPVPKMPIGLTRTFTPGISEIRSLIICATSSVLCVRCFNGMSATLISAELFEFCPIIPSLETPTFTNAFCTSGMASTICSTCRVIESVWASVAPAGNSSVAENSPRSDCGMNSKPTNIPAIMIEPMNSAIVATYTSHLRRSAVRSVPA